jgi:hypothetical protein
MKMQETAPGTVECRGSYTPFILTIVLRIFNPARVWLLAT